MSLELDELTINSLSGVLKATEGLVGDSATTADLPDSSNLRYVTDAHLVILGNTSNTNSGNETTSTLGVTINAATAATPNDTDLVATVESSVVKKITWTNVKAFLKIYFDTIYLTASSLTNYFNKTVDDTDDITVGTTNKFATAAEKTKVGFITVTQAVDLDTIESDTTTNNAKVTNATHTGEVTGSGALIIDKTAVTNKTLVTAVGTDHLLIADASDSDNLKKVLVSDLMGGGASWGGITGTLSSQTDLQSALDGKAAQINLNFEDYWTETFFTQATVTQPNLAGTAISAGTITTAIPAASLNGKFPYGVFIRSSTTADGGYRFKTSYEVTDYFGAATHKCQCIFLWRTAFTGRTVRIGFHDATTVTDAVDGAYFEILADAVNCKTSNNSTRTTTAMTATLSVDINYAFEIEVNVDGTSATFNLYNANTNTLIETKTITTNIPTTSARAFGAGIVATESSTTASDIGILKYFGFGTINGYLRLKG